MSEYPFTEYRTVTLDSGGAATVIGIGPILYGESWKIERFSVSTTARCKFTVYRGRDIAPQYQIDGTVRGELDTSETSLTLQAGDTVSFKWENGTAGSTGAIRIEGTKTVRGR